ncbi:MAG: peptide deformylase [Elusimicrobia bacterium GWC2_51_8]|nr:MAG: peptide deformylase [Elusimicrobia bacterium GWA2_51_34]OGR61632.1 MAG: peptide deformylase [Elusimicrobia bacterium GWC2_51_8]OGR88101.1 MAG: peptide deformylase [Elusimicrobia bacterium GWF2_52_66]HCE98485.1 peptide deformylase [Elusimicrobiota bacterium]
MSILRICKYGEKILEKKTRKVDFAKLKSELPSLLADMFETMDAVKGQGLAANQVGLDLRLSVIKIRKENDEDLRIIVINPEIVESSGSLHKEEGCLSFPGLFAKVKRFSKVKVRAYNEKGLPIEINAEGLFARALQHEIDHLDGMLFINRLPFTTRLRLKPVLFRLKKQWKKIDESKLKPVTGNQ